MNAPQEYYEALDNGDYDRLTDLLTPLFVHRRPDRTIEGRDQFIRFMRDGRPLTDTEHEIESTTVGEQRVVVEGTLYDSDGSAIFQFADVHEFEDGRIAQVRTYTT